MFSNTLKYAIEQTVIEFQAFIISKTDTTKYSDIDYKNAFYQRFMKNLKGTEYWVQYRWSFGFSNIKFIIQNGVVTTLEFVVTNKYNGCEKFINKCNETMKTVDLVKLQENSNKYVSLIETFDRAINSINTFKIK